MIISMTPSAIHQAIRLSKNPKEMEWLCQPTSPLPSGITELLELCASDKQIKEFAEKNHTDHIALKKMLISFVDSVLLNKANSNNKLLGVNQKDDSAAINSELYKKHYQLLIKIYHPDKNDSANAADQTARITKAYQETKMQKTENEFKNIRISHVPPNSFHAATTRAEQQISNTKTASLAILTIALISAVWVGGYIYKPFNPDLYSKNNDIKAKVTTTGRVTEQKALNEQAPNKQDTISKQKVIAVQNAQPTQAPSVKPFPVSSTTVSSTSLEPELFQNMLTNIEIAYEEGNATKIQGILNTPEINQQSDNEVFAKLENLFKITSDRKMLLYNFEWKYISGQITGKGKFLSRYQLNGDNQWLTREGVASILAGQQSDDTFTITSLRLDNNNIDQ